MWGFIIAGIFILFFSVISWLLWLVFRSSKKISEKELIYTDATIVRYEDKGSFTSLVVNFPIDGIKCRAFTYGVKRRDFSLNTSIPISYRRKDIDILKNSKTRVVNVYIELPHIKEQAEISQKRITLAMLILSSMLTFVGLIFLIIGIILTIF